MAEWKFDHVATSDTGHLSTTVIELGCIIYPLQRGNGERFVHYTIMSGQIAPDHETNMMRIIRAALLRSVCVLLSVQRDQYSLLPNTAEIKKESRKRSHLFGISRPQSLGSCHDRLLPWSASEQLGLPAPGLPSKARHICRPKTQQNAELRISSTAV